MAIIGRLVGQLLKSDSLAVVECDGKHIEVKNLFTLDGRPGTRCIVSEGDGDLPTLMAVMRGSDTIGVKSAGGS